MTAYEKGELIGRVGMAELYRGCHVALDRPVTIRFLAEPLMQDQRVVQRFLRAARSWARLEHPNIARVADLGQDENGRPYMVIEALQGEPLEVRLRRGMLPQAETIGVIRQVLAALEYAHSVGVVHQDLHAGNVLLARDGSVTVTDFATAGAPEAGVVEGAEKTGLRGDLYAAGILLYRMLTGRKPSEAEPSDTGHQFDAPSLLEGISPGLRALVERALAKEPAARFHSARAMREFLDAALDADLRGEPIAALMEQPDAGAQASDDADPEPAGSWYTRSWVGVPYVAWAVVGVVLVVVLLVALTLPRGSELAAAPSSGGGRQPAAPPQAPGAAEQPSVNIRPVPGPEQPASPSGEGEQPSQPDSEVPNGPAGLNGPGNAPAAPLGTPGEPQAPGSMPGETVPGTAPGADIPGTEASMPEPQPPAVEPSPAPQPRPRVVEIEPPAEPRRADPPRRSRPSGALTIYFDADSSTYGRSGARLPLRVEVFVDGEKRLETDDPEKREFDIGQLPAGPHLVEIVPRVGESSPEPRGEMITIEQGRKNSFKAVLRRKGGVSRIGKFGPLD
jgi:eukaryotic-like serine/threonine-protein kinase